MITIRIISTDGKHKLFKDYHATCNYINALEKKKVLEPGAKRWSFIYRRHDALRWVHDRNPSLKDFLSSKEKEAIESGKGLIEIIKGNRDYTTQLLIINRIDIEPLKREWCKEYFLEHGIEHTEWVIEKG